MEAAAQDRAGSWMETSTLWPMLPGSNKAYHNSSTISQVERDSQEGNCLTQVCQMAIKPVLFLSVILC